MIETIKTAARRVSAKYRKSSREETKQALDCNSQESDKQMFRYLRGDQAPASAAMYDPTKQQLIFDTCTQNELMIDQWDQISSMHKQNPPNFGNFLEAYGQYQPHQEGVPRELPTGKQLRARSQKAGDETAAGSDGWRPVELKALPLAAWDTRAKHLRLCAKKGKYPDPYHVVNMTALKKKPDSTLPLEHRMLTVFSALYRVETGAWYEILMPWVKKILHPDVVGALEGWEALDIAWDAQSFLEHAMLSQESKALVSYDFAKFFDAFDYDWTHQFLLHIGLPLELVELTTRFYKRQKRRVKKGRALSREFGAYNGYGQGDVLTLIPALLFVFWQFKLVQELYPGGLITDPEVRRKFVKGFVASV